MTDRRGIVVGIVGLLVLLLAAAGGWWLVDRSDSEGAPSVQVAGPSESDLRRLSDDVISGRLRLQRAAFDIPEGQRLEPAFVRELRSWRALEFDPESYTPLNDGIGTISATLVDGSGARTMWLLTVSEIDGMWRILVTEPAS